MQKLATLLLVFLSSSLFAQKTNPPATGKPAAKPGTAAPASKPATLPAVASATAVKKDTSILKLFEKPVDIKWVKYFKGRLDDATVVDITLGFDGRNCRGYLIYAKSRIRFNLTGTLDKEVFTLEERDMARGITGSLRGTFNNRRIEADWVNADNTLGSRLEAEEVAQAQAITLDCSDNKWSSRYITRFNGARCDMVLVRSHNGALDGFLWVESDGRTYRLKGDLKPDGNYEMEVLGSDDRLAALLSCNLKEGQNTD